MAVAKRQRREKPAKIQQKKVQGPRTGVRTSGKTNNIPGWPNLHRTGPGRDKHIERGAEASSLSLQSSRARFSSCLWVNMPSCPKDGFSCFLLNKIEL